MEENRHAEITSRFTLLEEMSLAGLLEQRGPTDIALNLLHPK